MKIIIYYLSLLLLLALVTGYIFSGEANAMSMKQVAGVSAVLVIYTIGISLVGEIKNTDEREIAHRNWSNRLALIVGTVFLSAAALFQLFRHATDYWLLAGLMAINLTKIISLIYSNYKK